MKIKGLPFRQWLILKAFLFRRRIRGDYELRFKDWISIIRLDSLWYGGSMVDVIYKGYTFHIEAIGDVYADLYSVQDGRHLCYVKDKNNNGNFGSEMLSYFQSDETLHDALSENPKVFRLDMQHGNWWECFCTDPAGNFHDLMWNLDEDNLFKAIAEALGGLDEVIKNLEEDAICAKA